MTFPVKGGVVPQAIPCKAMTHCSLFGVCFLAGGRLLSVPGSLAAISTQLCHTALPLWRSCKEVIAENEGIISRG